MGGGQAVKDQDWYADFMNQMYKEAMDHFLEDWQRYLASVMEGMSLESLLGDSDLGKFLGQFSQSRGFQPPPDESVYWVLGLNKTASDEEVKRRYRELAKRLHPDAAGKATEHLFKLVQAAYEQIARERRWK
jgi:DnaJ-domain-containing protein 1